MRISIDTRSPTARAPGAAGLLLGVLLAGCTVGNDPRQCDGKSYTDYLNEIIRATIEYEKRCNILDPSGDRDQQRRTLLLSSFPSYLTELRDKAAMGRRTGYDPSCFVNTLKEAPCSRTGVQAAAAACTGPGKDAFGCLEAGRVCQLPEECRNGYCRGIAAGAQCGSGVCLAWGGVGTPCPEGNVACDPKVAYCKSGACQPLEAEGVECEADYQCQQGFVCVRAQVGAVVGKCGTVKVGQQGEPCSLVEKIGQNCAPGLSCYRDASNVYRCQPTIKVGEKCTTSEACEGTATCVRAAVTDPEGVCRPLGKRDTECSADPLIGSACQSTLSCVTFDMNAPAVCQPLAENNQRCSQDLPCLTGVCDLAAPEPRCRPKSGAGLACVNNSDCASGQCDTATRKCKEPVCR